MYTTNFDVGDPSGGSSYRTFSFELLEGSPTEAQVKVSFTVTAPATYDLQLAEKQKLRDFPKSRVKAIGYLTLKERNGGSRIVEFNGKMITNSWVETTCIVCSYSGAS